jgi:hypothetical protein
MKRNPTTLSERLRQIVEDAPAGLMASTFMRAQKIIAETHAAGCSFLAYGDGGLATCFGRDAQPDPHGQELVRDEALYREVWRQMTILQGPENTPPTADLRDDETRGWFESRSVTEGERQAS